MEEEKNKQRSLHSWWFDSHNNTNIKRSPWLQSTLSELEEKTQAMMKVINEDANSFAKRAEMYYEKRPKLINMVEDFYRSHRSLAERYDLAKSGTGSRLVSPSKTLALSCTTSESETANNIISSRKTCVSTSAQEKLYESYFDAYELVEADESEVDDLEGVEVQTQTEIRKVEISSVVVDDELTKLKAEISRLKLENSIQMDQLVEKDEEKIKVIRQLSLAINMLREENLNLRKISKKETTPKEHKPVELNQPKEGFWKNLFNASQEHNKYITISYMSNILV